MKINKIPMAVILIAMFLAVGCAETNPLVKEARADYNRAKEDPAVVAQAPNALAEAEEQFKIIENLRKNGAGKVLINHHAYIAKKKVAVAQEMAVLNAKQDQVAAAEKEHQLALAEVQKAESAAAEMRAQQARMQAEEAQRHAEMLANRIDELEGEQTERGIVLTLSNVLFDFGKATLKAGSERNLAKISRFLIEYPERRVMIEGFTDSVGPETYNKKLSKERAEAVKAALVAQGIDTNRIETQGYGEEYAVADNSTKLGRQQNRRVEVVISDENGTITARRPIQ